MIKTFKHKGLREFYETGSKVAINPKHIRRLTIILQLLDAAEEPEALNVPGFDWHPLKGNAKGLYSVSVNGNWRIIYKFEKGDAILIDYLDYH